MNDTRIVAMPEQPRSELKTQKRLIERGTGAGGLGNRYVGEWHKREKNCCIEADLLRANLLNRGYSEPCISAALQKLLVATETTGVTCYQTNLRT